MPNWYLRLAGDNQNGGGYDGDTYPGGSNLSNQDSPALSVTDLASTTGTSIVTSATGGFTASMIGNAIRIKSGTNFTPGFYWITAVSDTNTATVHADPTNGSNASGGTARVGGAWGSFHPICASDAGTIKKLDGIACPFGSGDTLLIEGSGSDDPADIDYPKISGGTLFGFSFSGPMLWQPIPGTGRPYFEVDTYWIIGCVRITGMKIHPTSTTGLWGNNRSLDFEDCTFDNRGLSNLAAAYNGSMVNCRFVGGGGGGWIVRSSTYGWTMSGCTVVEWGSGVVLGAGNPSFVTNCILKGVHINSSHATENYHGLSLIGCTLDDSYITSVRGSLIIQNNVIANVTGTAISITSSGYEFRPHACNNAWYNVATKYNANISADVVGSGDVDCTSDPFVDQANGDYSPNSVADGGELLKGAGFPSGYNIDIGAVQAAEVSGGGGYYNPFMQPVTGQI